MGERLLEFFHDSLDHTTQKCLREYDEKVVLSDFDMWHCILNDDYLPLTVSDDKDEFTNDEKTFSWNNVFKYDIETDLWNTPKSTQATMWEIKKEWVLKVEHFVSR